MFLENGIIRDEHGSILVKIENKVDLIMNKEIVQLQILQSPQAGKAKLNKMYSMV